MKKLFSIATKSYENLAINFLKRQYVIRKVEKLTEVRNYSDPDLCARGRVISVRCHWPTAFNFLSPHFCGYSFFFFNSIMFNLVDYHILTC